jgi:hypothetical protein
MNPPGSRGDYFFTTLYTLKMTISGQEQKMTPRSKEASKRTDVDKYEEENHKQEKESEDQWNYTESLWWRGQQLPEETMIEESTLNWWSREKDENRQKWSNNENAMNILERKRNMRGTPTKE